MTRLDKSTTEIICCHLESAFRVFERCTTWFLSLFVLHRRYASRDWIMNSTCLDFFLNMDIVVVHHVMNPYSAKCFQEVYRFHKSFAFPSVPHPWEFDDDSWHHTCYLFYSICCTFVSLWIFTTWMYDYKIRLYLNKNIYTVYWSGPQTRSSCLSMNL